MRTDRRLDRNVEHLPRNEFAHLRDEFTTPILAVCAVHDDGKRIHLLAVDENINLADVRFAVFLEVVVHRRVTARCRLELVEEIEHDFVERHLVRQMHLTPVIRHVQLHATLEIA